MRKVKILIADDSSVIRKIISDIVLSNPDFEIVGMAYDGADTLKKIEELSPDLVTLDIQMPGISGMEVLKRIRAKYQLSEMPVLVISALTEQGAQETFDTLSAGANDYITKPFRSNGMEENLSNFSSLVISKIKSLIAHKIHRFADKEKVVFKYNDQDRKSTDAIEALGIGASTGGPNAILDLLTAIPEDINIPIFIVIHMPPMFTQKFAERLNVVSKLTVVEASDGMIAENNTVYIAPGNYHMTVRKDHSGACRILLNQNPPENFCRPSVDVLFRSLAEVYGKNLIAVVMTGMGHDGLSGSREIKKQGGRIIVQDEASSIIWSMPASVVKAGLAEDQVSLKDMAYVLYSKIAISRSRNYYFLNKKGETR